MLGATRSGVTVSVASLLRLFKLPQISYASTAALLSDAEMFDYFFRTVPSDAFQARAMADIIVHFNWTYVFALFSEDTYGREGIDSLIEELISRNDSSTCIAQRIALPVGVSQEEPFDAVVERMQQEWVRNASVAVLFGHTNEATAIMRAIKKLGESRLNGGKTLQNITWIASDSWGVNFPVEYHQMAGGMLGVQPKPGSNLDGFRRYFDSLSPANGPMDNPWFNEYWELVFNCSLTGQDNRCDLSSQNLSTAIESDSFMSYTIDAVYAFAHAVDRMRRDLCPGNETLLCNAIMARRSTGEAINGTILHSYLFNVSFSSTFSSGQLFDANGDVQGSYSIKNLQFNPMGESSFEEVATWDHINRLQFTNRPIQWIGGSEDPPQSVCSLPCDPGHEPHLPSGQEDCCWECRPCQGDNTASSGQENCYPCPDKHMPDPERSSCVEIPLSHFDYSSPWAIVILLLTCVGIVATIFVAAMFAVFHKRKVIKASSRELSAILLSGILLCYVLPFFFVVRPSPALCGVRRFLIGFCFAISYSALLVRSNRIHRIFNQTSKTVASPPRFIGPVSQVVITAILIGVQVLIAVVWLSVERPSIETVQVDGRTVELRCGESPYFGLSISLCYNLFLLLLTTYFAFLTRRVPDNFNEAKFVNVTVYSLCIIWLGFLPAYFISIQFGTDYSHFFLLLAIILSASITLLCLLAPKVVIVVMGKEEDADVTTKFSANHTTMTTTAP